MAYVLTYTMDQIIAHCLTKLGVIPAGGAPSGDQETEAEIAIQAALHSLDSTNLYTGNTKELPVSIAATSHSAALTATTGIHSVIGVTFYYSSPKIYFPLELVPAQKLGAFGSPYINGVPTKCCAVLSGQPESATQSKLVLNAAVPVNSTIDMIYREALTVMTLDSGTLQLPPAFLRMVILMTCCDLAGSFGVELGIRQELRALLTDAMNLALAGAAGVEPGPAMRAAAASQGTVPPATFQGMGGIP